MSCLRPLRGSHMSALASAACGVALRQVLRCGAFPLTDPIDEATLQCIERS